MIMVRHVILIGAVAIGLAWYLRVAGHEVEDQVVPHYIEVVLKPSATTECSAAFFNGAQSRAVVFVPGAVFDKESWYELAGRLQGLKIASLSLDGKTPRDVQAGIAFLKGKGFDRITLAGGSMGGAAILGALENGVDDAVSQVILLAPAGGSPLKNGRIDKLFIVAKEDALGLYPDVRLLYEGSAEPKRFVEFEGTEHAQHLFKGEHKEALSNLLVEFVSGRE